MISISNLYIQYGDRILFDSISTTINIGEKIGLTGRNGAGKSTLLKILAGEITQFDGVVDRPRNETVAYLHQDIEISGEHSVIEEAMKAFEELNEIERQIQIAEHDLTIRDDYESDSYAKLIDNLTHLTEQFEYRGGNQKEANAEKILKGLGFKSHEFSKKVKELSGGWQMRVELAKMLLTKPDYLLLDEPTNHLDIESIIWLESFLSDYKGAVVMISHDKIFLDKITRRTIEIELGRIYDYQANYSDYLLQRVERRALMMAAYENQQKLIAQKEKTIARFMAKATKTSMAQSMQKQLDKIERIELEDEDTSAIRLSFPSAPRSAEVLLDASGLEKSYNGVNVFRDVDFRITRGERVAFVGQNGMGKSTLAKILVGKENADKGTVVIGPNTFLGYYAQNQTEVLQGNLTLLETMENESPPERRTQLRNILGSLMFSGEDVDKKVSVLSGGERGRLALALLLLHPINLLVLDEPTNHLDLKAKEVLKKAIMDYDGTMIVVSHDRDFLSGLTEKTIEFRDNTIKEYLGDVNYFLDKRQMETFREVEAVQKQTANSQPKNSARVDNSKKQEIEKTEKRINELEAKIKSLHDKMMTDDFYNSPDYQKTTTQYTNLQKELEIEMTRWEEML
ncbi:MAG: ABC transporter [Candidatus Parvibacillus calidus]|nr:MAG: ABC transporter [Candidatus Parvibacillus calidus]WKZ63722.1 MAG: ABC-F family ATP-binding cassette domain-containing protein [Saprospiraceae bacterium]